jgi:dihydroorotase
LIEAATGGDKMFFLGTDTAPHTDRAKECACGSAGIFSAPHALELYAQIFDSVGKIHNLEAFASLNGPAFYGLPVNKTRITLQKKAAVEIKPILTEEGQKITVFNPSTALMWHSI